MTTVMCIFLALGLAMDAFAVSMTNGMCCRIHPAKNALSSGLAFGAFQGLMPLIGYFAGNAFSDVVSSVDHWVALALLGFLGGRMIHEALNEQEQPVGNKPFALKTLLVQAVATSIDALAVGVTLGVMQVDIQTAVSIIALITFAFSFSGVLIGRSLGALLGTKAELLGGVILVLIGLRIFLEHTAF